MRATVPASEDVYWRAADGLRLHAVHYMPDPAHGQSRGTVVCIPGLTRNNADFRPIASILAQSGWQVFAIDLRGRAGSQHASDKRSYSQRVYATDIAALLDREHVQSAVFIGTSLGVLVTMTMAAMRPELICAAVVNDAGPEVPGQALARIGRYAGKRVPPMDAEAAIAYVASIGSTAFPKYGPEQWRSMVGRMFRERPDGLLEPDYDPAIVRTINPLMLWLSRPLLWRAWRKLARRGPILILRGAISDLLPLDLAKRMAAQATDAHLVEIPDVGHAPMLDEPEAIEAITALLARLG